MNEHSPSMASRVEVGMVQFPRAILRACLLDGSFGLLFPRVFSRAWRDD